MVEGFFNLPLEQSKIKSQIVAGYFDAWAKIIAQHTPLIAYVDLFAGQGYYEDGTESTPLLVLKKAIENEKVASKLQTEFNDSNAEYTHCLEEAVQSTAGLRKLQYRPQFSSIEVTDEIVKKYDVPGRPPTLFFLDPWGYKGVFLDLIKVGVQPWASECILFFNYNRVNMDLNNPFVDKNINDLLGLPCANQLRSTVGSMTPIKREQAIVEAFCGALRQMGGKYTLPFCFRDRKKDRTSHYLVHITKKELGFGIMKEIMAKYSEQDNNQVPSYTYDPKPDKQLLFSFNAPLNELKKSLVQTFRGQNVTVQHIYDKHQPTGRFIKPNYKRALTELEEQNKVCVDVPREKRRRHKGQVTLGDKRIISFPL